MANRELKITACTVAHTGERNGRPYTIYEIKATKPDGTPLPPDMKLRSFTELPIGQLVEVDVKRFEGTHGVSYTLQPKKGQTTARVNELAQRVEALEALVKHLAERMTSVEGTLVRHVENGGTPPAGVPVVASSSDADADIPF